MRISAFNSYRSFGSNYNLDDNHFQDFEDEENIRVWCDDGCSEIRDALRAHIYGQMLPYYDFKGSSSVMPRVIEDANIRNISKIGNNSYRGASLIVNLDYLDLLKPSNVSTIIDLAGFDKLENACREKEIEYFRYVVDDKYWNNPIFYDDKTLINKKSNELYSRGLHKKEFDEELNSYIKYVDEERDKFKEKFFELVNTTNEGHFYISCEFGELRTPNILALTSIFSPKWSGIKTLPTGINFFDAMRNMYNNLTERDKERLGFTKKYDESLRKWLNN